MKTKDAFTFTLSNWNHKVSEPCNAFSVYTVWRDVKEQNTPYKIDQFSSLLFQDANRPVDCIITVEEFTTDKGVETEYF